MMPFAYLTEHSCFVHGFWCCCYLLQDSVAPRVLEIRCYRHQIVVFKSQRELLNDMGPEHNICTGSPGK